VWNGSVYIANYGGGIDQKIMKFPLDFDEATIPVGYGSSPPTTSIFYGGSIYFYGAQHFIAGRKNSLIIMDKGSWGTIALINVDRLISIEDITGSGWISFGTSGSALNQFNFYSYISPFM